MSKRFLKNILEQRRIETVAIAVESVFPKPAIKVEEEKVERRYFISGDTDGGHYPQNINLNRHVCDTYFYTENGKIKGGDVKILVNGRYKVGCRFKDWDYEWLLKHSSEVSEEEWRKWLYED